MRKQNRILINFIIERLSKSQSKNVNVAQTVMKMIN